MERIAMTMVYAQLVMCVCGGSVSGITTRVGALTLEIVRGPIHVRWQGERKACVCTHSEVLGKSAMIHCPARLMTGVMKKEDVEGLR